jgi:hypothetical protein
LKTSNYTICVISNSAVMIHESREEWITILMSVVGIVSLNWSGMFQQITCNELHDVYGISWVQHLPLTDFGHELEDPNSNPIETQGKTTML